MSYFSGIFSSAANQEEQQPQEDQQRPRTRSQTRVDNLQLPANNAVNTFNGIARGRRTPSPRPVGHNANSAVIFQYDSTNISQRTLQPQSHGNAADAAFSINLPSQSPIMSNTASIEELRAAAAAAVEAANVATSALAAAANLVAQQGSQQQQTQIRTRKPDLPEFDPRNIDIWIKRTEAAYDRAGICLPRDKFAFLESKFAVGANPSIDAFLYGPANDDTWSSFLTYLREEYGRTVRQEAQYLRGQFSRDGRRPSQMLAHIKEKVKRVTIDDVLKEIIVSSLPGDVQQMLAERVKEASAEEAASIADRYFDQEGKPLHSRQPAIQHIDTPTVDDFHDDDDADVNAIGGRRGNFRPRGGNNNNNNRFSKPFNNAPRHNNNQPNRTGFKNRPGGVATPSSSASASNTSSTSSSASAAASSSKANRLCLNHQRHGDNTMTCYPGCARFKEMRQGNAPAGGRM